MAFRLLRFIQPDKALRDLSQEVDFILIRELGEGQLPYGRTHVDLDPDYLRTVTINQQHAMKVFIQVNDPNCNGTAVIRGNSGFEGVSQGGLSES